jgi:isoaspartyl peptidase/L-asparaginase-like protein (Ntn-hydrolase superfamily)
MVMDRTPHVMLAGEAATRFALDQGLPQTNLLSPQAGKSFDDWRHAHERDPGHDTIGMLALDRLGQLAGGCSTSGTKFKLPGRVGDSPIIGAGLYLLPGVAAASATGKGEEVMKVCGSFSVVENIRRGMEPRDAIAQVLNEILRRRGGDASVDVSFIALRSDGAYAGLTLQSKTHFQYAVISRGGKRLVNAGAVCTG